MDGRDSPLTERGIAQAHAIGHRLNTLLDASAVEIISSPQPRAQRTAEIIRESFDSAVSPVRPDDRLCEVSIGEWGPRRHIGWHYCSVPGTVVADADGPHRAEGRHTSLDDVICA